MKTSTKLWLSFALLTAAGCDQERTGTGDAVTAMAQFRDKMCACPDTTCAKAVTAEMIAWGTAQAKAAGAKVPTPSAAEAKVLDEYTKAVGKCSSDLEAATKAAKQPAEKS